MSATRSPSFQTVYTLAVFCVLLARTAAQAQSAPGLYDGCAQVLAGPRCVLATSGKLIVWLDVRDAQPISWRLDSATLTPTAVPAADGHRFSFELEARGGTLRAMDARGTQMFALELVAPRPLPALDRANQQVAQGNPVAALALLDEALAAAPRSQEAPLLRARARVHDKLGDQAASHRDYRAAIATAAQEGQLRTGALAALALEFSLRHDNGDLEAARSVLEPFDTAAAGHALDSYFLSYHAGMIAFRAGNVRRHLALMRDAARIATRFGWTARTLRAQTRLAVQWQNLGRRSEARQLLEDWRDRLPAAMGDCDRAFFWTNVGWAQLLELEAEERSSDPLPALERAATLSDAHCRLTDRVNARVNLALAYWHAGSIDQASAELDAARELSTTPATHIVYWSLDLAARIHVARGQFDEALALYDQLELRARAAGLSADRWRALVRRGWTLQAAGQTDAAMSAYDRAQDVLDDEVLRVPLQEGRETLLATRRFASLRHLDLLLARGDNESALALVRRDRARALRLAHVAARLERLTGDERSRWEQTVARYREQRERLSREQADSWTLSARALADLEVRAQRGQAQLDRELDEAIARLNVTQTDNPALRVENKAPLVSFARTVTDWIVLIEGPGGVEALRTNCGDAVGADAAACLVSNAAHRLTGMPSVRLIADDSLADISWQALPLGAGLWIDHATIRHVVDLPATTRATPVPGNALLVGDPTGNLRAARAEVRDVQNRLGDGSGWTGQILTGQQATPTMLRDALPGAALFHYAGHATFGDDLGWDSALELADGTRFNVSDILTLGGTPELVVLSGCETAKKSGLSTPTMGLANAFIASGASAVIATTRPVDDASARAVTLAFYDQWLAGAGIGDALRAAQLDVRDRRGDLDWSAFRLIEP